MVTGESSTIQYLERPPPYIDSSRTSLKRSVVKFRTTVPLWSPDQPLALYHASHRSFYTCMSRLVHIEFLHQTPDLLEGFWWEATGSAGSTRNTGECLPYDNGTGHRWVMEKRSLQWNGLSFSQLGKGMISSHPPPMIQSVPRGHIFKISRR